MIFLKERILGMIFDKSHIKKFHCRNLIKNQMPQVLPKTLRLTVVSKGPDSGSDPEVTLQVYAVSTLT